MTNSKNTCGGCCCNDCERKLPEELHCCCNCVCKTICVTISIPYDSDCDCDEVSAEFDYDCVTDSWHGTIECEGLSVDLEFIVKQCNGNCYVCLVSDCLGMPYGTCPNDCQEFTPGRGFCRGTYDGIERTGGFAATWDNLDFSGCGDTYCGTGTITIGCADRVFPSCRGDCSESLCINCDCLCRCICLTYSDDDCLVTVEACWDYSVNGWTASIVCPDETITITITVGADEYDACELRITTSIGDADPVALDSCPDVDASWTIIKGDSSEASIDIVCRKCDECGVEVECCPNPVPLVLTATFGDNDFCAVVVGLVVTLTYDAGENEWTGSGTIPCDDPEPGPAPFTLAMRCLSDGRWQMDIVATPDCGSDTTETPIKPHTDNVCEPFRQVFRALSLICPENCCDIVDITVTE